jgi:hypothetical protein
MDGKPCQSFGENSTCMQCQSGHVDLARNYAGKLVNLLVTLEQIQYLFTAREQNTNYFMATNTFVFLLLP